MGRSWLGVAGAGLLLAACGAHPGAAPTPPTTAHTSAHTATPSPSPSPSPTIDLHASNAVVASRAGDVPVLCYHQIRDWTASDSTVDRPYIMPIATFRSEMAYLAANGFHTITPDQLTAHLTTGAALPTRPILLSFDDADENQWTNALPVLRADHFTATFFAMTVVLGKTNYMTDDQLRALDREGMTIGGHTWDHHRVDEYAGDDWTVQITQPAATLQKILGHPVRYFAYPYGVWKPDAFAHLQGAGFWAAFQLDEKPVDASDPLDTLQRSIANPYWTMAQFEQHLT